MAASLPSVDTTSIEQKHAQSLTGFAQRTKSLSDRAAKGVTRMLAEEANELETDANRWIRAFDEETKPQKQRLFEAHRWFTGFCDKFTRGPSEARRIARQVQDVYDLDQKRIALAKQREIDEANRLQAEHDRQAEINAKLAEAAALEKAGDADTAQAVLEEAREVEATPVVPIAAPQVEPIKIEGRSTAFKLVGTVKEPARYFAFLLGIPYTESMSARADLLNEAIGSFSQSGINAQLKRGLKLQEHGVDVVNQPIGRNMNR